MIFVAIVGAVINAASALLFMSQGSRDLNVRSAFLHLASDAVLALGVAITGGLILMTGWLWLDPAVSIVLAITILAGTWSLAVKSLDLMLDAVPEGIDPEEVKAFLGALPGVVEVHDLHIWALSTTETALTAHVVMPGLRAAADVPVRSVRPAPAQVRHRPLDAADRPRRSPRSLRAGSRRSRLEAASCGTRGRPCWTRPGSTASRRATRGARRARPP